MDYFNGITNEDFLFFFSQDINCRPELSQFMYPHETIDYPDIIDEHIERCCQILYHYIYKTIIDTIYLSEIVIQNHEEIQNVYEHKKIELRPLLAFVVKNTLRM